MPVLRKVDGLIVRLLPLRVPPALLEVDRSISTVDAASEGAAAAMVTTGADQAAPLTMVRRLGVCGVPSHRWLAFGRAKHSVALP